MKDKKQIALKKILPTGVSIGQIESLLKGSCHRTRIEILYFLKENPESVLGKISEFINSTNQNTSSHIDKMLRGGLLLKQQSGKFVLHKLSQKGILLIDFIENLFK